MMTLVIFLTTTGFALNKHQCSGANETYISFSGTKKSCCAADPKTAKCPKDCCNDESIYVHLDADYSNVLQAHNLDVFVVEIFSIYLKLDPYNVLEGASQINKYEESPPFRKRNIPVLFQTFLI